MCVGGDIPVCVFVSVWGCVCEGHSIVCMRRSSVCMRHSSVCMCVCETF